MKIYKVKVNGKVFEVELESITENKASILSEPRKASIASTGEGTPLLAPIQGIVLKVNVTAGDEIKKGDVLLIIEAMKLENDIVAPKDGVIKEVKVSKGQEVDYKEELLIIG